MSEIKDRLKLFRRDKDLTQEDLATQTAISRTYISTVEAGRQDPSFAFIKTLSKTYNLSIDWLLTGEGSMFLPSTSSATVPAEALEEETVRAMEIVKDDPLTQRTALMMGMMSEAQRRDILARAEEIKQRDDEAREVRELKEQIRELMEKATG